MKKRILLKIINKEDPTDFDEGYMDLRVYNRMVKLKKKSGLSWEKFIHKLLKNKNDGIKRK